MQKMNYLAKNFAFSKFLTFVSGADYIFHIFKRNELQETSINNGYQFQKKLKCWVIFFPKWEKVPIFFIDCKIIEGFRQKKL